jgi:SAM-dependent methyltransferase
MKRPHDNYENLINMFGKVSGRIKHLDYGGGEGFLVKLLRESGWNSTSYDLFVNKDMKIEDLGTFDLITAFEVFEHVPDVNALMSDLRRLLVPNGIVFFSTMLSDANIHKNKRLNWWYASPRNGHISIFSKASLKLLAKNHGLNYGNASNVFHFMWTTIPDWAQNLKPASTEDSQ